MSMDKLEKAIDAIQEFADVVEQFFIGLVAKSTTWAAAMIPALLIYTAILKYFPDLPPWGAYLIAYVIEALGLTTITNTVEAWSKWCLGNSNGEKSTFWIAFSTAAFYLVLNIILVVVLKIAPDYARVATGLLSSLSVVSAVGTVMRLKQQEHATEERRAKRHAEKIKAEERKRQDERERQQFEFEQERLRLELDAKLEAERLKLQAKLSNSLSKSASKMDKNTPVEPVDKPKLDVKKDDELDKILSIYQDDPFATLRFVGEQIGRSPQTIKNRLDDMEVKKIIHRNGNGVEILTDFGKA